MTTAPREKRTPVADNSPPENEVIAPAGWWLLLIVFVAGAALMAYEIVGSRLLAPFFGSSTFVWGSLIGVFLGALSLGYAIGGRVVDRFPTAGALAIVLGCASVLVGISSIVAQPIQSAVVAVDFGVRTNPLVSAVLLFGPASILMGMVSPFAVRLRAGTIATVGTTAGSLYGLSTAGSIVGTLAAAFWLVQSVGSQATVLLVAAVLAGCSLLASLHAPGGLVHRLVAGGAIVFALLFLISGSAADEGSEFTSVGSGFSPVFKQGGFEAEFNPGSGTLVETTESRYHDIHVVDYAAGEIIDEPARVMHFNNSLQAATPLTADGELADPSQPVFSYLRAFDLQPAIQPDAEKVLFIGLGSGASAMRLHKLRPDVEIDVVEIDGEVVDVAREHFGYRDSTNGIPEIETHVGDGRTWLAAHDEKWDAIIVDAYFADSIPFHLTTTEFVGLMDERLADDGIVVANIIGAVEGPRGELFRAIANTYQEHFEDIVVYPVPRRDGSVPQDSFINLELFAADRGVLPPAGAELTLLESLQESVDGSVDDLTNDRITALVNARLERLPDLADSPVLTDDLAPVDALLSVNQ